MPAVLGVRTAAVAEAERLAGVLARAFFDDPLVCYLFPDTRRRGERLHRFFDLQLRHNYLVRGEVLADPEGRACALWLPPATGAPRFVDVLAQAAMPFTLGVRLGAARRVAALLQSRHPAEPHWYLGPIGTEPGWQRQGRGTALISPVLARCDREGRAAYLESSNQTNLPLYLRLGFEVTEELRVAADGPLLWLMLRRPQQAG